MASVRQRKKGGRWYARYIDENGKPRERVAFTDKRESQRFADDLEARAAKIREGLIDPRELVQRDHSKTPLSEHVEAFRAHLEAKGGTATHIALVLQQARRLLAIASGAEFSEVAPPRSTKRAQLDRIEADIDRRLAAARLVILDAGRIQAALKTLRDAGLSPRTCNHYRASVKSFASWAWKSGRLPADPLASVTGFNAKEDVRHDRRTIGVDELRRLVEAAHNGPRWRKMSGPARALCYRLAAGTGLRHKEIRSIRPESFNWTAEPPTVTVTAGNAKNRQTATLPLPPDLAEDLRPFVAAIAPGEPVFPMPNREGARMLKPDLEAAGIPYEDADGRVFDFHSLRCQLATSLDQAGVTPRVVQKLMRHSTLELTGRYTRPRTVDLDAAAMSIPSLRPQADGSESLRKTGTDDFAHRLAGKADPEIVAEAVKDGANGPKSRENLAHYLPIGGDVSGRKPPHTDVIALAHEQPSMLVSPHERRGLTHVAASSRGERGVETGGIEPPTSWLQTRRSPD